MNHFTMPHELFDYTVSAAINTLDPDAREAIWLMLNKAVNYNGEACDIMWSYIYDHDYCVEELGIENNESLYEKIEEIIAGS